MNNTSCNLIMISYRSWWSRVSTGCAFSEPRSGTSYIPEHFLDYSGLIVTSLASTSQIVWGSSKHIKSKYFPDSCLSQVYFPCLFFFCKSFLLKLLLFAQELRYFWTWWWWWKHCNSYFLVYFLKVCFFEVVNQFFKNANK